MSDPLQYFQSHETDYLKKLKHLVAIPSVSFPGFEQKVVGECGNEVKKLFTEVGLENIQTFPGGHPERPYIYGEWLKAPGRPTVLMYGHYDVQPPGNLDKWQSPPFELTEKNGRLFARGSADDKGGLIANLAAIDSILKSVGSLPVNVKILAEGEEECGSGGLDNFVAKNKSLIQADVIIITDADNYDEQTAGLTVSLRGLISMSVEVQALKQPVHSGLLGGPLPDSAMALSKILATLVDDSGEISIPEIREMVVPLSADDRQELSSLPFDEHKFRDESGILPETKLRCSAGEILEHLWFKPSFSINCFQASSQAQAGNVVVASAWARIGLRTVPNIDNEKAKQLLQEHIERQTAFGLKAKVSNVSVGTWWKTKTDHPAFKQMEAALAKGWGRASVKIGCGGSIPFVQTFTDALGGAPALLIGVCDPKTFAHSENESMSIEVWRKSVRSLIHFLSSF